MKPYLRHSISRRVIAAGLALLQLWIVAPTAELPAAIIAELQKPAPVRANRTVPKVAPVPAFPVFSAQPGNEEITRARVFEEPLIPMSGTPASTENAELAKALLAYLHSGNTEDLTPLDTFLKEHPESIWRASLLTDMGIVYRRTGYFSKAIDIWQQAWELARDETEPKARAIADRAIAEYAELSARLGRYEILNPLFKDLESRSIGGSSAEKLHGAQQGLWLMENRPQEAFRCGPMALDRILAFEKGAGYKSDLRLFQSESTKRGMSLPQVMDLGNNIGMKLQMAKRSSGAEVLLPAVIHWKAGHYAALIREEEGRFLVQDPTFGDELWVSRKAIEDEASGYFLVRDRTLPEGWTVVDRTEGGNIWGKGNTGQKDPQAQRPYDDKAKDCECPKAMPVYNMHLMLISLNITDIPVGYAPPRGPAVDFHLTYNQAEAFQPAVFSYTNVGKKWTFDWLSYITDNPSNLTASVTHYVQGGGEETFSGYDSMTQSYAPHHQTRGVAVRTSSSPIEYELRMPDGSVYVFAQPDGASSFPRKVFMTEWIDTTGNGLTFTYDSNLRLTAVTDAIGQVTTLSYELGSDPLKITRVTDPFGRYATVAYDATGRIQSITDQIGMQSSFEYDGSDFIRVMTTPYGKTGFLFGQSGTQRWIEATDPLGAIERVEFRHAAPGISSTAPSGQVPAGMSIGNTFLQYRNSFYWDKRAFALYAGDYTKAQLTHWLHTIDTNVSSGVIESTKQPLENRVWYQYPNQPATWTIGSTAQPIKIGRVLDDGTTQLVQMDYNKVGKVIKTIDPLNRETVYVYGNNNTPDSTPSTGTGLDLLQIKQKNGGSYDILGAFSYNSHHQPLTTTDAALQGTTMTYTANSELETVVTAPRGGLTAAQRTTTYAYYADNASLGPGQLQRITGPVSGATTDFAYDDHGRVATVTGSDGYAIATAYDALDRPTSITYPDSTTGQITYDKLDVSATKDRAGRWTHYFHDAARRLVSTRDPQGRIVTHQWCNCGVLQKIIDANGNAIGWTLDVQGRVTQETRADSSYTAFVYENTTSRLKRKTSPNGEHKDYTYFKDDNVNALSYPNAAHATAPVSFTYDTAYNRIATMVDGIGTTSYSYNAITTGTGTLGAGALASINGPFSNDTIAYTYDELGRNISRSINSVSASQTYDPLGRIDAVTNALGSFGYSYVDQTSRPSSVTYPNGQTTEFSYFNNAGDRRLQEIHHKLSGGATLSKFDYEYNTVGNITTWTQQRDSGGTAVTRAYDFSYDRADQLTAADYRTTGGSPTLLTRYVYSYDTAGNRTAEQIDDTVLQAGYDNMNRLTSRTPGGPLQFAGTLNEAATVTVEGKSAEVTSDNKFSTTKVVPSGTSSVQVVAKDYSGNTRTNTYEVSQSGSSSTFSYDGNGNLTSDGARTFEWDAENRLLAVEAGTHRSEFSYDGQSRRVRIAEKDSGSITSDTVYLWCGMEVCEERDSTGATTNKRFFDQGEQQGSNAFFYTRDHLDSVRELTDNSGAVSARYDYDPYGRRSKLSGSGDTIFGFTGHTTHTPTTLVLAPFRAYDTAIGRWLSPDPIGIAGGINLYAYVDNQPLGSIDVLGLDRATPRMTPRHIYIEDILAPLGNAAAGGTDALFPGLGGYLGGSSIDPCSIAYKIGWWGATGLEVAATAGTRTGIKKAAEEAGETGVRKVVEKAAKAIPKARSLGNRIKSMDDKLEQLKEIEEAQLKTRRNQSDKIIDSIGKSKQNAKKQLKDIANDPSLLDDLN